jgi:hypothetical protein
MTEPHIRIFPHSSKDEFPSRDTLTTWLLTSLKARGGEYRLKSSDAVADLPPGSVVLFRYANLIVGEAIVIKHSRKSTVDKNLVGKKKKYSAQVWFSPSSIRVYAPPIGIEKLQGFIDKYSNKSQNLTSAQPYYKIDDWNVYRELLADHVCNRERPGIFI